MAGPRSIPRVGAGGSHDRRVDLGARGDHVGGDSLFEVDVFAVEAGQLSGVPADVVVEPGPDVRFAPLIKLRRYLGEVGRVLKVA